MPTSEGRPDAPAPPHAAAGGAAPAGTLLVIAGPSGVGKTTIVHELVRRFGGTVNRWYADHVADEAERTRRRAFNEAFLEAQMRAVERVMRDRCGDLGFPSP